jgi:hypothetical protein
MNYSMLLSSLCCLTVCVALVNGQVHAPLNADERIAAEEKRLKK